MKKVLIGIVAALAIFALAAPAPAIMKITSQGYMEVNGIYISGNPIDDNSRGNDWYNMEMIVEPTLHINDKVRLLSQVRIMERNWTGTGRLAGQPGESFDTSAGKYDIFGNDANNFYVERLYLAANLFGGTLYVGRMSGGAFGYAFGDNESNADRIRYVRRFGAVTIVGVYEKSAERDGGLNPPRVNNLQTDPSWDAADNDNDSYGLAAVIPLGKMGLLRLLSWNIREGRHSGNDVDWTHLGWACLGLNFGMLKIDTELNFGYADRDNALPDGDDLTLTQWSWWGEAGVTPGPFELWGGGFWIQGEDSTNPNDDSRVGGFWNVGVNYEPTLLLFSEDMGLLWGYGGNIGVQVPNGSVGPSGIWAVHVRGSYKLTDAMKLRAILQYVEFDEMELNNVDEEIGYEFDLGFEWKFMPNITYIIEGGYFSPGDYFKDTFDEDESIYAVRNTIRVEW